MKKMGYVYILSSGFKPLYIGVTNDLGRRVWEHKNPTDMDSFDGGAGQSNGWELKMTAEKVSPPY